MKDLLKKKSPTNITQNEQQVLKSWTLTYTRAVRQRTVRQETTVEKMGTLPHYLDTQDTHKVARNTVPYNNENDKRASTCDLLNDASNSQNDEESNVDQCKFKETDEFNEESNVEEGNAGLADIVDAALFLFGRCTCFSIRKSYKNEQWIFRIDNIFIL